MASIAMMALGAVLNAAAFTGGNYLAKALSSDGGKAALEEKKNAMTRRWKNSPGTSKDTKNRGMQLKTGSNNRTGRNTK